MVMKFEWHPAKAEINEAKHGISFESAKVSFDLPAIEIVDARNDYGELRINRFGRLIDGTPVCITYTRRDGITRLISVRKAKREERDLIP